ncbi:NMT1-like family protein [Salinihabitans flavidus]|uniref:NMT1-like family protein n=1 Tax=Salinihabitans flavidus TaxID=569882 RepID=A0A1H8UWE2_9RHOB|nr:ABC transporter substrate-binding protein [Salinihabitans flavidus]SEP07532.1 NMT1-like family protein [Salinihabitans flavidus]
MKKPTSHIAALTFSAGIMASIAVAQAQSGPIEFLYSPFTDYAPFFVAQEMGMFERYGVDVSLAPKTGTAETIQLVASGNSEGGAATWGAGLFNSINMGATVTIVATMARMPESGRSPSPFMVSQQAWEDGIRSVEDLRGQRVGIPGPGGFGIYSVALALETGGLTVNDVEAVYLPPPATAAAFLNGSIQAGWSIEPFATRLEEEGLAQRLVEDHAYGVELGFIAFNTEFVEANEDAIVGLLAGYIEASRLLDGGGWDDPEVQGIIGEYTGMEPDLLNNIAYTVRPADGTINLDSVRAQEAFFHSMGALEYEGEIDISQVYRTDLLERANALVDSAQQ